MEFFIIAVLMYIVILIDDIYQYKFGDNRYLTTSIMDLIKQQPIAIAMALLWPITIPTIIMINVINKYFDKD